jgi:hypothetical protein
MKEFIEGRVSGESTHHTLGAPERTQGRHFVELQAARAGYLASYSSLIEVTFKVSPSTSPVTSARR